MISEIIPICDEIREFELILGQLARYKVAIWCTINYRIPYQEIWIVSHKEFLTGFGLGSFENKTYMGVVS